jgi:hypothetical protein
MLPDMDVDVRSSAVDDAGAVDDAEDGFWVEIHSGKYVSGSRIEPRRMVFYKMYVPGKLPDSIVDVIGFVCGEVAVQLCKGSFRGEKGSRKVWMDNVFVGQGARRIDGGTEIRVPLTYPEDIA